jgi:tetratricopeptide (TPR) repeat protein
MRFILFVLAVLLIAPAARADQTDPRLADLFTRLQSTMAEEQANAIANQIWSIWITSDDAAAGDLMAAGIALMSLGRPAEALDRFDKLVEIAPQFAEAWNKRATVHFLLDNYQQSVDDIERTLALEPRHFGALSGLGLIYMETGEDDIALRAFEGALKVNPHLPGARQNIEIINRRLKQKAI